MTMLRITLESGKDWQTDEEKSYYSACAFKVSDDLWETMQTLLCMLVPYEDRSYTPS